MSAIVIGVGATLLMDAWHLLLRSAFQVASLDYALLGRWVLHMAGGSIAHADIRKTESRTGERMVGWTVHYTIGVTLAATFLLVAPKGWSAQPTLLPALLFGVVTVVFPLFVLQPALGFGVGSSRSPRPWQARLRSIVTHAVFGAGLYLCGLVLAGAYSM
jgi:hypothetical protein